MGRRRSFWLAAPVAVALAISASSAIPVVVGGLYADLGGLGGCAIQVQYSDGLGMLIAVAV